MPELFCVLLLLLLVQHLVDFLLLLLLLFIQLLLLLLVLDKQFSDLLVLNRIRYRLYEVREQAYKINENQENNDPLEAVGDVLFLLGGRHEICEQHHMVAQYLDQELVE